MVAFQLVAIGLQAGALLWLLFELRKLEKAQKAKTDAIIAFAKSIASIGKANHGETSSDPRREYREN